MRPYIHPGSELHLFPYLLIRTMATGYIPMTSGMLGLVTVTLATENSVWSELEVHLGTQFPPGAHSLSAPVSALPVIVGRRPVSVSPLALPIIAFAVCSAGRPSGVAGTRPALRSVVRLVPGPAARAVATRLALGHRPVRVAAGRVPGLGALRIRVPGYVLAGWRVLALLRLALAAIRALSSRGALRAAGPGAPRVGVARALAGPRGLAQRFWRTALVGVVVTVLLRVHHERPVQVRLHVRPQRARVSGGPALSRVPVQRLAASQQVLLAHLAGALLPHRLGRLLVLLLFLPARQGREVVCSVVGVMVVR